MTGPNSGWNSMFHTAPTATREATYGKKNAVLYTTIPFILEFNSTAMRRAATMVRGTVNTA